MLAHYIIEVAALAVVAALFWWGLIKEWKDERTVAPDGERPFLVRLVSMTAGKDRHSPERAGYGSLPANKAERRI